MFPRKGGIIFFRYNCAVSRFRELSQVQRHSLSMLRCRIYERSGVRPSVRPSVPSINMCRRISTDRCRRPSGGCGQRLVESRGTRLNSLVQSTNCFSFFYLYGWLSSRVVSVLDSGAVRPGFKSQSRRWRVTVLGKLFTPIVPLFTKQRNW